MSYKTNNNSDIESFDPTPSPNCAEYIHNNDYAQKMRQQEWLADKAIKTRIRPVEKQQKCEKCLLKKSL